MGEAPGDDGPPNGPPVLLAGLRRPAPAPGALVRQGLVDQLDAGDGVRLALVIGPAGYGKSTLLAQWADRVHASGPVAWVNLEPGDNDPLVLWSRVVIALQRACPDLDLEISMGSAGKWSRLDMALVRLVNFLDTQGPLVLVLDDFHRMTHREVRESLAWFVENVPGNVRLALGSRTEPRLRISSMRARGEVAQVRSEQLSFTPDEADWLLNQRFGLGLDPSDVVTLVTRTEGWPAGLQLAAMSMANTPDRHGFVTAFGASHRHVQDYLVEEVLDSYGEELHSLMVRISILERMCGPVVDAVLDQPGSGRHLAELAHTNLFLIPLDENGTWYRFHHLFGQLLRVELDRSDPGLAEELHRRASSWFQGAGRPAEAISHILQARDFEAACELIEGNWVEFAMLGRYQTVQGWIESLPPGRVQADARLLLIQKWLLDLGGRHAEADALESEMRRSGVPARGPQRDGFASLASGQAMRRALFTRGDVSAQVADGRRVLELEDDDGTFVALAWFTVGLGSLLLGDIQEADRSLTRAGELALASGQWIVLGSAWAYRALMAPEGSDEIVDLATRASRVITEHHLQGMAGEASLALARATASTAPPEQVLALVQDGIAGQRVWGQPTELAYGLLWAARLSAAFGDLGLARGYAAEAGSIIGGLTDPGALTQGLADLRVPRHGPRTLPSEQLTEAEIRVLELLPGGGSERDIGEALFLSFNTVHTHVRGIYRKLGVSSRADAVARAYTLGFIGDDFT